MTTLHAVPITDVVDHDVAPDCICGIERRRFTRRDGSLGWIAYHHPLDTDCASAFRFVVAPDPVVEPEPEPQGNVVRGWLAAVAGGLVIAAPFVPVGMWLVDKW